MANYMGEETSKNVFENAHREERGMSVSEGVDLSRNLEAKIRNPLAGLSKEELMRDVEIFAETRGLMEHLELLKRGALVAQNPAEIRNISGSEKLLPDELEILEFEATHRWRMPWRLFLTIFTCSIGAAVQGWDQTGSNGATIFFPDYYGIGGSSARDTLLVGLINSAPYIASAFIGCWLSDPLNNAIGRRGVIFIAAQFCIWPVIGSAFSETWYQQLACRLLMGIGMGVKASTVPVYAAENSPASIRGALVMSWQMWTAFGIMLGTAINLAVFHVPNINWRLMLGAPFIPAVPLSLFIYLCPESPRWLMKKNRYADAWKSMRRLRYHDIQVARDIFYIGIQLDIEHKIIGDSNYATRFFQLFTIPRVRRATLAAFTVMFAQQLCGINIIAFYSTTIFLKSGLSQYQAMIGSFGFGLVNWLFAFPAFWTIDTFGRRTLLLFTFPNMFWTLLAAGLCTLIGGENTPVADLSSSLSDAKRGLICLFVFLFAAFYSPGEGPVPFTYSAEVFPLSHREVGMGFAVATCLFWAAALGMTLPFLLNRIQAVGVFGMYAGLNIVALIMIFFFVPETMQRTLEELDYVFAVPVRKFAAYQVTIALPFWIKKWLLFGFVRDPHAKCKPLYTFEKTATSGIGHLAPANNSGSDDEKKSS